MNPTSIVTAYEVCNMSPDEIAEAEGLELEVVKLALKQNSRIFNAGIKGGQEEDITDAEYKQILGKYKELALYSESDFVRERASRQLINEKKGRNDLKKSQRSLLRTNILMVNNMIVQARQSKQSVKLPTIDVELELVKA